MKQMKILGVLAMALTLGLAACNGGGAGSGSQASGSSGKQSSSRHTHTAAADAKWNGDDNYHWKDCVANDGGKVDNKKHDFGEATVIKEATCKEAGSQKVVCNTCGKEVIQEIKKLDHTFGEWTTVQEPDCTNPGTRKHVCTVCETEETEAINPTGHTYADADNDGEDDVVWTTAPTCEEGGVGKKVCTVCSAEEPVQAEALGHDWTIGENPTVTPAQGEGYANFYEFPCANGCGKTSLGFKADEPTTESKTHLVIGSDGGARFWGRPIGNAVALDAEGTADSSNHDPIFDKNEPGDFFEYKFDLTKEQAETLSTCRCYCDAKPASYLAGKDFWKCKEGDEEWTPGMYIDDNPEHLEFESDGTTPVMVDEIDHETGEKTGNQVQKGKIISDYRYILYVDGEVQAFDPTIEAPVGGSSGREPRAEYVMPFTFHLKEGTNTISLRMAGGYRSTFYNFYFRQYVAPAPAQGE